MITTYQPFDENKSESGGKYYFLFWAMVFCFAILGGRLWYLQVVQGDELLGRVELNRTRLAEVNPVRGLILDRNGIVLVENKASFDLSVQKGNVKNAETLITELAEIFGLDRDDLMARYRAIDRKYVDVVLIKNITWDQLVAVESRRYFLEGVSIQVSTQRHPLIDVLASHTIGYLGEISKEMLEREKKAVEDEIRRRVSEGETREEADSLSKWDLKPHRQGDLIGLIGIEQSMEYFLHGRRGLVQREVNANERVLSEVIKEEPEPGNNIRLTIDSRLQAMAQSLLGDRAGAIVAMDPRNFEILALASSPTFKLSDFSGGISTQKWKDLQGDPFTPQVHRAVAGQYPPGSTYKIAVALAALAEGVITPNTTFHCSGSLKIGNDTFRCHNRFGHGTVDLKKSLTVSCDVYYYEVGRLLGIDRMSKRIGEFFGLGRKTGVELNSENAGLLPTTDWMKRRYKKRWSLGDTISASIGQGAVSTTPLQVAQMTAVLANGGTLYRPHLIKEIVDNRGQVVASFEPEVISEIKADPEFFAAIKRGLEAVVNDPGGTGKRAALPDIRVAGKTGTSQVVSNKMVESYDRNRIPYARRDHAWFTAYAPAENPEIVVTVLLEHTGGGGTFAAPLARQLLAAFFDKSIQPGTLPPPQIQPDKATFWRSAID